MNKRLVVGGMVALAMVLLVFIAFGTNKGGRVKGLSVSGPVKRLMAENKLDEVRAVLDKDSENGKDSGALGKAYFELAGAYEKNNEPVKARDIYGLILSRYQNVDNIAEVQERLGRLNINILFSPTITDKDVLYKIQPGDTLSRIAKKFGTTVDLIKAANSLESDIIRAGASLKASKVKYNILIDKSQNILTLLTSDGAIVKVYKVATGENNCTPIGTFKIINKIKDPVWYTEGAIVPAESPDNILGSRWMGLSIKGYGIHGTVDSDSIGKQTTSGCVRMLKKDAEELYTIVPSGTEVTIVD